MEIAVFSMTPGPNKSHLALDGTAHAGFWRWLYHEKPMDRCSARLDSWAHAISDSCYVLTIMHSSDA